MADVKMKRGDTAPVLTYICKDADGNPVDLTDADVVFSMREMRATEPVINEAMADLSDSPETGGVSYAWADGDTDVAGGYLGEFEVTFSDDTVETFPSQGGIRIAIYEDFEEVS